MLKGYHKNSRFQSQEYILPTKHTQEAMCPIIKDPRLEKQLPRSFTQACITIDHSQGWNEPIIYILYLIDFD